MLSPDTRKFILDHLSDDLPRLLLSAHRYPGIPVPAAVAQIEALNKIRTKVPSWYRFDLVFPPLVSVEQASSEPTARFKSGLFSGKRMADLTGGMGVDAFFFARQFDEVVYVEQNSVLVALARDNFRQLGARNIQCLEGTAEQLPDLESGRFDLLYLDPGRRGNGQQRVSRLEDCQPNILEIKAKLLALSPRVLLKTAPMLDLHLAVAQLGGSVSHIWVVSVDNEVKEVLYLLEAPDREPASEGSRKTIVENAIPIEAVALGTPDRFFSFTWAAEQSAAPAYSEPLQYLYEPDAAILKSGAFKAFALGYGLFKLHPNTHLYTSETLVPEVPGRTFQVEAAVAYDRAAVARVLPAGKANVAVRNFPDTAEMVRKKLRLGDGGTAYLFAATVADGRKKILLCRRLP